MIEFSKQKIVVPVDFSDRSFQALETALKLAEKPSQVHAIHVLQDVSPTEPGVVWGVIDNASRIEHVKQALAERLQGEKYRGLVMKVAIGDPGHQITDYAEKNGADLIMMPSHGRTGIKRLLIGSVAERVVRLAHCPVLVLRD